MKYWVIEHRSRGCFKMWDHSRTTGKFVPTFSWSVLRSHPDVRRFYHEEFARREMKKISAHVAGCYLVEMTR